MLSSFVAWSLARVRQPQACRKAALVLVVVALVGGLVGWAVITQVRLTRLKHDLGRVEAQLLEQTFPWQTLQTRLEAWEHQPAAAWESYSLQGPDHQLGFPVVYAAESHPPVIYEPRRKGLRVRYTGNHFRAGVQQGILYCQVRSGALDEPLLAQAVPAALTPGEEFTILDDAFYDFAVGVLFVKVRRHKNNHEGYLDYTTVIGETIVTPDPTQGRRIPFGQSAVYVVFDSSFTGLRELADDMDQGQFGGKGQSFHPDQANPLTAGGRVLGGLLGSLREDLPADLRQRLIAGGERFFRDYGIPQAKMRPGGGSAWPYAAEWTMDWQLTLRPPWFSGYGNAVMALNAAILYHHTGDRTYKDLALKAVQFLRTPMAEGGALYHVGRFPHLAEYAYPSPPLPNVRVLDGEMVAVLCVHDTAVLLRDSSLLNLSMRLVAGLSNDLKASTTKDNKVINARYPWLLDNQNYLTTMKAWAAMLADAGKDQRFLDYSRRWELAPAPWR